MSHYESDYEAHCMRYSVLYCMNEVMHTVIMSHTV